MSKSNPKSTSPISLGSWQELSSKSCFPKVIWLTLPSSMNKSTKDIVDIRILERNPIGLRNLSIIIFSCLMNTIAIAVLLVFGGLILHPYLGSSVLFNMAVISLSIFSLFNRRLFYKRFFMSTITAICMVHTMITFYLFAHDLLFYISILNVAIMLLLWTAFATNIKNRPAIYLHPFMLKGQSADIEMSDISKTVS